MAGSRRGLSEAGSGLAQGRGLRGLLLPLQTAGARGRPVRCPSPSRVETALNENCASVLPEREPWLAAKGVRREPVSSAHRGPPTKRQGEAGCC